MGLVQFAEPLNAIMLSDPDPFVRQLAIHAAATLKSDVNFSTVLTLAANPPADLRWVVLCALTAFARDSCRPYLEAAFRDKASAKHDRIIAAWGLGKLGDPVAVDYLVRTLDDLEIRDEHGFDPGESRRAAQALCNIYSWPFEWLTSSVDETRERCRRLQT
jgi:HEAT repeat protein